jgi:hypothetical protein
MSLMFSTSNHLHDRDLLLSDQDRQRIAEERRAALIVVTSHGDIPLEVARDLAIAEAMASSHGMGCMEGALLDQMDLAMTAGLTCADIDIDFEPAPLLPAWVGRLADRITNLGRALLDYLRQPSPFD